MKYSSFKYPTLAGSCDMPSSVTSPLPPVTGPLTVGVATAELDEAPDATAGDARASAANATSSVAPHFAPRVSNHALNMRSPGVIWTPPCCGRF
jgi:hypothetical protein